jgi:hypothetical protein
MADWADASPFTPNIIIAGAPKCGTTSVFEWLTDHPCVVGSNVKETYFLMDRDSPLFNPSSNFLDQGIQGYAAYFPSTNTDTRLRLEATPDYLYQEVPLTALQEFPHDVKVVFFLRNPSERAYSAYKFFSGHKSVFDAPVTFPEYLNLIRSNNYPTSHPLWPLVKNTIEYGEYINYLDKWAAALGQDNIIICLYEDLKDDPKTLMLDLSRRLGIDNTSYEYYDYKIHNRSYAVKNIRLHRIKNKLASFIPNSTLKRSIGRLYKAANVNAPEDERPDDVQLAMDKLATHYRRYNERLSVNFGINLDRWNSA